MLADDKNPNGFTQNQSEERMFGIENELAQPAFALREDIIICGVAEEGII